MSQEGKLLSGQDIESILNEIGEMLASNGEIAEFAIFGGSAISLMFNFRDSTRDVDYMPVSGNMSALIEASKKIGEKHELAEGWLNDAIEIFKSDNPDLNFHGEYPVGKPGIRVFTCSPEYLFAMKALSMRSSLSSNDVFDAWNLIDQLGLDSSDKAFEIVEKFYPGGLPERNRLILMDVFESKFAGEAYSPMLGW